jgi:predicted transcriptional regulator
MEIRFPAELQTKLSRLAAQRGQDTEALVMEAVEHMVNYDEWFATEVEKGLAQIERGQTLSHEEAGDRLDKYFAHKMPRA